MGREIPDAISDFNAFCNGLHPAFNGLNGTHKVLLNDQKAPDLQIHSKNQGLFYKFAAGTQDIHLLLGTLD